jgi:hypothetical protein
MLDVLQLALAVLEAVPGVQFRWRLAHRRLAMVAAQRSWVVQEVAMSI